MARVPGGRRMGVGILFYLVIWVAGVLLALLVGAALFRAAVALANRSLGPVRRGEPIGWDWDADEDDDPAPAAAAIPEPSLGRGMSVLFLTALVVLAVLVAVESNFLREFGLRRRTAEQVGLVALLAAGFLALASFSALSLPTTFRRAALAALFFYLILAAVVLVAAGLLFAVFG